MRFARFRTRRWLPRGRLARQTRGLLLGGAWLRCVTWWRAHALDDQLARGADPMRMSSPLIRRAEVRANRELLLELADRLRAGGPLGVEGLATTSLLVGDGLSPLFCKGTGSLTASANYALLALERGHPTDGNVGAT
jgi:hypothetical protein